jgi:hypothetical protein
VDQAIQQWIQHDRYDGRRDYCVRRSGGKHIQLLGCRGQYQRKLADLRKSNSDRDTDPQAIAEQ